MLRVLPLLASCAALQLPAAPLSLRRNLASSGHALQHAAASPLQPRLSPQAAPAGGVRISPLTYGADPLGQQDSSPAFALCVEACLNYSSAIDSLGHFPGDVSFGNGKYIRNAGGCQIDLGGGEYKLSQPIVIPEYVGNMALGHGSLVADDTPGVFPADSFLITVGVAGSCKVPQGSCGLDFAFPELFLDGRHVASGISISNVMGTTIGPSSYFLNFSSYGIQINQGHEVLVDRCWLGETNFDYPFSQTDLPQAIAIQINVR